MEHPLEAPAPTIRPTEVEVNSGSVSLHTGCLRASKLSTPPTGRQTACTRWTALHGTSKTSAGSCAASRGHAGARRVRQGAADVHRENSAMANLLLNMMGAFAEFERELIRERQHEGIALAKERGVYRVIPYPSPKSRSPKSRSPSCASAPASQRPCWRRNAASAERPCTPPSGPEHHLRKGEAKKA